MKKTSYEFLNKITGAWEKIEFKNLRQGMIIMMFDENFNIIRNHFGGCIYIVLKNPRLDETDSSKAYVVSDYYTYEDDIFN